MRRCLIRERLEFTAAADPQTLEGHVIACLRLTSEGLYDHRVVRTAKTGRQVAAVVEEAKDEAAAKMEDFLFGDARRALDVLESKLPALLKAEAQAVREALR